MSTSRLLSDPTEFVWGSITTSNPVILFWIEVALQYIPILLVDKSSTSKHSRRGTSTVWWHVIRQNYTIRNLPAVEMFKNGHNFQSPVSPDSVESAQREISFFFPEFSTGEWMKKDEPLFRSGQVRYDHQKQIHTLPTQSWPQNCCFSHWSPTTTEKVRYELSQKTPHAMHDVTSVTPEE